MESSSVTLLKCCYKILSLVSEVYLIILRTQDREKQIPKLKHDTHNIFFEHKETTMLQFCKFQPVLFLLQIKNFIQAVYSEVPNPNKGRCSSHYRVVKRLELTRRYSFSRSGHASRIVATLCRSASNSNIINKYNILRFLNIYIVAGMCPS